MCSVDLLGRVFVGAVGREELVLRNCGQCCTCNSLHMIAVVTQDQVASRYSRVTLKNGATCHYFIGACLYRKYTTVSSFNADRPLTPAYEQVNSLQRESARF